MTTTDSPSLRKLRHFADQARHGYDVVTVYADDLRAVLSALDAAKACADERGRVIERLTGVKQIHVCDGCRS